MKTVADYVVTIPDFPVEGIMFRDVTSILEDAEGLKLAIDTLIDRVKDLDFDVVAGPESRGFIFGMPIAYTLGKRFAAVRKAGKLPRDVVQTSYDLEYGSATIELHKTSIRPGDKVLLLDDLIATGGSAAAAAKLVEELGGKIVRVQFLMELAGLNGRAALSGYDVDSVIVYEGK